jgi:hypothetical protein
MAAVKLPLLVLRGLLWVFLGIPLPRTRRVEPVPITVKCSPSVSWTFLRKPLLQLLNAGRVPEQECLGNRGVRLATV